MTLDERLKLGQPLHTLIGSCLAAESLTVESNLKGFAEMLIRRANELQQVWDEMHRTDSNVQEGQ